MDTLPEVWVRAHPFGDQSNKDSHGEYFDASTNFYDDWLHEIPVNYYHNHTPDGKPSDEPIAIGIATERQYKNPITGEADGRWDKIKFFDDMSQDIRTRVKHAIESETLRASPSTVPDFHKVKRDGHISHWLSGALAIFDADGSRQPANPRAIGIAQMKSLFKAANLDFPTELERTNAMTEPLTLQSMFTEMKNWLKAKLNVDALTPEQQKVWGVVFDEDEETETEEDKKDGEDSPDKLKEFATMADKANEQAESDLRLTFEKQQNEMKAMQLQNQELMQRLDRADIEKWLDGTVNAEGVKVTPAEREDVIALALQLKGAAHTMKAANGDDTTAFALFQKSIEEREIKIPLNTMKFNEVNSGEKGKDDLSPTTINALLAKTAFGSAILADQNGKK